MNDIPHYEHPDVCGEAKWCSDCERELSDCVCEELCDFLRETVGSYSGEDVRVPASPESYGLEPEAYTIEEANTRRKEWHNES